MDYLKHNGVEVSTRLLSYLIYNDILGEYVEAIRIAGQGNRRVDNIDQSFVWINTEEGMDFWERHHDAFNRGKEGMMLLPEGVLRLRLGAKAPSIRTEPMI